MTRSLLEVASEAEGEGRKVLEGAGIVEEGEKKTGTSHKGLVPVLGGRRPSRKGGNGRQRPALLKEGENETRTSHLRLVRAGNRRRRRRRGRKGRNEP